MKATINAELIVASQRNAERFHLTAGGYVESGAVGDFGVQGGPAMRWRPHQAGDWNPAAAPARTEVAPRVPYTLADMAAASVRALTPPPPPAPPWWRSLFTWPTKPSDRTPGDAT
jgi:hypothetical protein